jgi:hypothetical protein
MTIWDGIKYLVLGGVAYFIGYVIGWRDRGKEDKL